MMYVVCDRLTEDHTQYMYTLVNRKNYGIQENVDKFKTEVVKFNPLIINLTH